jgi:hypothetical protein
VKKTGSLLLGLIILTALCWALYQLLAKVLSTLAALDKSVVAAIVITCGTVVVSVITVVVGRILEKRALIEKEHREQKIPIYMELLGFLFRFLMGEKTGRTPSEKEVLEFVELFNQKFMVWGSDSVLKSWVEYRKHFASGEPSDTKTAMLLLEKLIREIRRDLGHKNRNLVPGDILSLFINDIDAVLNKPKE